MKNSINDDELMHHGTLGMKWYHRKDGYTHGYIPEKYRAQYEAGKKRAKEAATKAYQAEKKYGKIAIEKSKEAYQAYKDKKKDPYLLADDKGNENGRSKKLYKMNPAKLTNDQLANAINRMSKESNFKSNYDKLVTSKAKDMSIADQLAGKKSKDVLTTTQKIANAKEIKSFKKAYKNIDKLSDKEIVDMSNRMSKILSYYKSVNADHTLSKPTEVKIAYKTLEDISGIKGLANTLEKGPIPAMKKAAIGYMADSIRNNFMTTVNETKEKIDLNKEVKKYLDDASDTQAEKKLMKSNDKLYELENQSRENGRKARAFTEAYYNAMNDSSLSDNKKSNARDEYERNMDKLNKSNATIGYLYNAEKSKNTAYEKIVNDQKEKKKK